MYDEEKMLELYRQLDFRGQRFVLAFMRGYLRAENDQKPKRKDK